MTFPRFAGKHSADAVLTPSTLLSHRVEQLGETVPDNLPSRLILTYQPQLLSAVRSLEATTTVNVGGLTQTLYSLDRTNGDVGVVGGFGIGAPAAVAVLEEMIALGVTSFVSMGAAGAIADLAVGDLVVCDGAVRDEGTSHHYVAADVAATPDQDLTDALAAALAASDSDHEVGRTWTIDALFRETPDEVRHYASNGVLTVEMEAAALFVVAAARGVSLGAAFCVSDLLAGGVWQAAFDSDRLVGNMWKLFETSVSVLAARH